MEQRKDKGQAGLSILLSIVVMLFVIGLIVMIYSIMSGQMAETDILYTTTSGALNGEAVTQANFITGGDTLVAGAYRDGKCTITAVYNGTATGTRILAGNYTEVSECRILNSTSTYITANWIVNYTYTYSADTSGAIGVINDTTIAISGVTDWYDIIVVIGAMVVLILLVVLIITAIRGSGLTGESSSAKPNVGTA